MIAELEAKLTALGVEIVPPLLEEVKVLGHGCSFIQAHIGHEDAVADLASYIREKAGQKVQFALLPTPHYPADECVHVQRGNVRGRLIRAKLRDGGPLTRFDVIVRDASHEGLQ